jgi:hypothetical protein
MYVEDGFGDIDPVAAIQIDLYARELVKDMMNEDGPASVLIFFEDLKKTCPGFDYRVARNADGQLTAWMFMSAEMRYMVRKYGDILFGDSKKSDISSFDWPYFPITVMIMDEENNLYVCAHALAIQESSGAYEWVLKSIGND